MAGLAAGALESLMSSPFEFVKLRAQVTSASRVQTPTPTTDSRSVGPVISKLLRGYTPDVKALSHSTALLSTLSAKHPDLVGALREHPWMMTGSGRPPSVSDVCKPSHAISLEGWSAFWRGLRSVSAAAGVSGSVAAAASHCFDTAKCRFQCTVLPKYLRYERALLKWRRPGTRFERATGIHPADRNVLFRGIWLRMARSGVASFVIVGTYYFAVDQLLS
ncbi:unnamed protein product [Linum trigynum]|uniref:Mitochondrial carrier protein n=1 Tax=Linum trigynum TaxID=586398 RepID=A0AAV2C7X2_9ROSI